MFNKHQHPKSSVLVSGMRLAHGAVLCAEDVYDSTFGSWESCPTPGLILGNTPTLWVRPRNLTRDEKDLLGYLASRPKGCFDCIAEKPSDARRFVVVPGPDFNWDTRIETPRVRHPECIQPLQDFGFLTKDPRDHSVEFFLLTDAGRAVAIQLAT